MKRWFVLTLPFLLTGCPLDDKKEVIIKQPSQCFDIINTGNNNPPPSPVLLDKCTGETWMLLRTEILPSIKGSKAIDAYRWYKIDRMEKENSVESPTKP